VVSEAAPGPVEPEFDQVAGIEGGATPGQSIFRITAQECAADIVALGERRLKIAADFPGATPHRSNGPNGEIRFIEQ